MEDENKIMLPIEIIEDRDEDFDFMVEDSSAQAGMGLVKHFKVITKKQYESDLKEAYCAGWEDRNESRWYGIMGRRTPSKEEYFKSFMEEKERVNSKVIFEDDDGYQD